MATKNPNAIPVLNLNGLKLKEGDKGFLSLDGTNTIHVEGIGLCKVGHRKSFETLTLPDGRVTQVKTTSLWFLPVEASTPVQNSAPEAFNTAKVKAAKAPAATPANAPSELDELKAQMKAMMQGMQLLAAKIG